MHLRLRAFLRLALDYFAKDQRLQIGSIQILLPSYHKLPKLKATYPKYDQFLPFLADEFPDDGIVIDIGANCGDTFASIAIVNPNLKQVVVEPDSEFLKYLHINIGIIKKRYPELEVSVISKAILRAHKPFRLVGSSGTKSMDFDQSSEIIPSQTLDDVLSEVEVAKVCLVKVDVDGFDFEVLLSGLRSLANLKEALIYFEMDVSDLDQFEGYLELHGALLEIGYSQWYLFDNFGNFFQKSDSYNQITSVIKYSIGQKNSSKPAIYYFDVLVCRPSQVEKVQRIIENYENSYG